MRNYWTTSDTHFLHHNIIKYCDRPFVNVDEMTETLVENWNKVVKKGDYVYHLGDVFMHVPRTIEEHEKRRWIWSRLNGRKTLILGNHDDVEYLTKYPFFHEIVLWKPWNGPSKSKLLFTHVPVHQSSLIDDERGGINVHGHTHNHGSPEGPYRCVCVELTNYTPVNLEEIV